MRHYCFMQNVRVTEGDSPWDRCHLKGHFDKDKRYPFGCTVDFLSRPDEVKALPKFAPRGSVGPTCWIPSPTWRTLER